MRKVCIIDNYDSFTYTIVQYFRMLGCVVDVFKNDELSLPELEAFHPQRIVLSPGPGNPGQAGSTLEVIKRFADRLPILGICLGHQALSEAFGGRIIHAKKPMHGKVSEILNTGVGVFHGLPSKFHVARYHSLVVSEKDLPSVFEITATSENVDREIMAMQHKNLPLFGVQFHPEAIQTEHGLQLLENFLSF